MRTASLGLLAAASLLALTACTPPAPGPVAAPAVESSQPATPGSGSTSTDSASTSGDRASIEEVLADFPADFPLPELDPVAAERVNYAWTIDYAVDAEDETGIVADAEAFGSLGYTAIEVAEELLRFAGADARTWAWENEEFRVDIALIPAADTSTLRYVVDWK